MGPEGWALGPRYPTPTLILSSNPRSLVTHPRPLVPALEATSSGLPAHLVRVQSKVSIQEAPHIIRFPAFIHLISGVPNLHVHGPIGHPLVLEALSSGET